MSGFFNKEMAAAYDARNRQLAPIIDNLHFLTRLVLSNLPGRARVLCVGVGTGAEILSLARAFPDWTFVGVDPSGEMLEVCGHRLEDAGLSLRSSLHQGYVEDLPADLRYDAVVSLLVAHFVRREARPAFYREIHHRLEPGGLFLSAEISADLDAAAFPALLADWKKVQALMGVPAEGLAQVEAMLRDGLAVMTPEETETQWKEAGFAVPTPFFQALLIRGWHARKAGANL